jgi:threonine synthase
MVTYCSTRGDVKGASFEDVVLAGLASDRGLFVPESIPMFTAEEVIFISMSSGCAVFQKIV